MMKTLSTTQCLRSLNDSKKSDKNLVGRGGSFVSSHIVLYWKQSEYSVALESSQIVLCYGNIQLKEKKKTWLLHSKNSLQLIMCF